VAKPLGALGLKPLGFINIKTLAEINVNKMKMDNICNSIRFEDTKQLVEYAGSISIKNPT
jgi:hypothetical protein